MIQKYKLPLCCFAILAFAASPARAEPYTYAPETCEFQMEFPEKPYMEQKCTSGEKKACTEVVTYTKVIDVDSSVNVRITCNQYDAKELEKYTPEVMKETIKQMTTQASLPVEDVNTGDENGFKSATAVNISTRGGRDIFYTAQIWIGKTSMFTLEADMTGPQSDKADQIFTEVLQGMRPKEPTSKP